jgi:hypothetical protein
MTLPSQHQSQPQKHFHMVVKKIQIKNKFAKRTGNMSTSNQYGMRGTHQQADVKPECKSYEKITEEMNQNRQATKVIIHD